MQQNPTQTPDQRLTNAEREVLYMLTGMKGDQPIWSVPDIGREIESAETRRSPQTACFAPASSTRPQMATCSPRVQASAWCR